MGELRKHGKRNDFRGDSLCNGKVTDLVAKALVSLLQMQRNGIVNAGADSPFRKKCLEWFALLHSHDVQMIDTFRPRRLNRSYDCRSFASANT